MEDSSLPLHNHHHYNYHQVLLLKQMYSLHSLKILDLVSIPLFLYPTIDILLNSDQITILHYRLNYVAISTSTLLLQPFYEAFTLQLPTFLTSTLKF